MPRPMVPLPATPATRSLREMSSMRGESAILSGGRDYNRRGRRRRSEAMLAALRLATVATALLAASPAALAQAFPSKPITLICPFPPGGGTDTHLRRFAELAQKYLGPPVVVESTPGAGGTLGPG